MSAYSPAAIDSVLRAVRFWPRAAVIDRFEELVCADVGTPLPNSRQRLNGASVYLPHRARYNVACLAASDPFRSTPVRPEEVERHLAWAIEGGKTTAWAALDPSFDHYRDRYHDKFRRAIARRGSHRPLSRLDMIGSVSAELLATSGIHAAADLLREAGPAVNRKGLSTTTRIDAATLQRWAHLAEIAELLSGNTVAPAPPPKEESSPPEPKPPTVVVCCCREDRGGGHEFGEPISARHGKPGVATTATLDPAKADEKPIDEWEYPRPTGPSPADRLDATNLLALAGVVTAKQLAAWKGRTELLVPMLERLNDDLGVVPKSFSLDFVAVGVERASQQAHYVRVEGDAGASSPAGSDKPKAKVEGEETKGSTAADDK